LCSSVLLSFFVLVTRNLLCPSICRPAFLPRSSFLLFLTVSSLHSFIPPEKQTQEGRLSCGGEDGERHSLCLCCIYSFSLCISVVSLGQKRKKGRSGWRRVFRRWREPALGEEVRKWDLSHSYVHWKGWAEVREDGVENPASSFFKRSRCVRGQRGKVGRASEEKLE